MRIDAIDAGPGADPERSVPLVGEGIHPVIRQAVQGEKGLPIAVFVTRHTAGVGTEPFVVVFVDADGKHILVCQAVFTGEGLPHGVACQIDLMHAYRGSHPKGLGLGFDGQGPHVNVLAHLETIQNPRQGFHGGCFLWRRYRRFRLTAGTQAKAGEHKRDDNASVLRTRFWQVDFLSHLPFH